MSVCRPDESHAADPVPPLAAGKQDRCPAELPVPCRWRLCRLMPAPGASAEAFDDKAQPREAREWAADKPPGCRRPYPHCQILRPAEPWNAEAAAGQPLRHRLYMDFETACEIREAWDDLALAEGDLFSSFDWCALWWQWYGKGRRLEIHAFEKGGHLVGVIPLFRERLSVGPLGVTVVGIVGCDHSTATANIALRTEFIEEIVPALIRAVTESPWDLIHFGHLPGYFRHEKALVRHLGASPAVGSVVSPTNPLPHALLDLPDHYEAYIQSLSYRERHSVRKENRRLQGDHGACASDAVTEVGSLRGLREFIDLHQRQWTEKGRAGHFADWPCAEGFHRDLAFVQAAAARLRLRRIHADNELFTMNYAIRFGERLHWFLASRSMDPKWHFCFPGRVGACDLIQAAIAEGVRQLELGIGYYPYKVKLGGRLYRVAEVVAVRRGWWPAVRVACLRVVALMHELAGYRLWYLKISSWLGVSSRPMHERWIRTRFWPGDAVDLAHACLRGLHLPGSLYRRLRRRWSEVGGLRGVPQLLAHQYRRLFRRRHIVYAIDPHTVSSPDGREPEGFSVRRYRLPNEVGEAEIAAVIDHGGRNMWLDHHRDLRLGNELWVGYVGDEPAGVCWLSGPEAVGRYLVPLEDGDRVIRKCVTFTPFRRRGVYAAMLRRMIQACRDEGAGRVYIDTTDWNVASQGGIRRAGFVEVEPGA